MANVLRLTAGIHTEAGGGGNAITRRNTSPPDADAVAETLDRVAEELAVLLEVIDEIRSEPQWANRNRPDNDEPVGMTRRITSMPLDPVAPDSAVRPNPSSTNCGYSHRSHTLFPGLKLTLKFAPEPTLIRRAANAATTPRA